MSNNNVASFVPSIEKTNTPEGKGFTKVNKAPVRPRIGKTARDHANGAKQKNQQNKDSRALWQNDSKRTAANFPYASCNGQRNRYQVTGKDGQTVIIGDKKK